LVVSYPGPDVTEQSSARKFSFSDCVRPVHRAKHILRSRAGNCSSKRPHPMAEDIVARFSLSALRPSNRPNSGLAWFVLSGREVGCGEGLAPPQLLTSPHLCRTCSASDHLRRPRIYVLNATCPAPRAIRPCTPRACDHNAGKYGRTFRRMRVA